MSIKVTFPDGNIKKYKKNITPLEIAESISKNLAIRTITAKVNDRLVDIDMPIREDATITLYDFETEIGKEVFWHSTAHLMAQAVKDLFPKVKVAIGPAIEEGFYYDFDCEESFTDEDLELIEKKMLQYAKEKLVYKRKELTKEKAFRKFKRLKETYKLELIDELPEDEIISTYTQGSFVDLCRGPHIINTGKIKAVKLLKTSGAYWRGSEKNKMLQRIYGISFPSKKELKDYLVNLEEKKKRDHRRIAKDLDLFSITDEVGAGLVLWHPNGAMIRSIIEDYWKEEHFKAGYSVVNTPHIGKSDLWKTSGHLEYFTENMYSPIEVEGQMYYLKPMNCPFHISIYNSNKRSYRELPVRYAELGTVYRYERSGVLHGLMRVRGFTQDDAHIICTPEQLDQEVENLIDFSFRLLRKFGFNEFQVYLSTRPEKAVGEIEDWNKATLSLEKALKKFDVDFQVDEGGGAFYGPKIDIKIKDALNRSWQCTTIQFDFNLPKRFKMEYTGSDNQPHEPFMIHRALLGSIERFFGTLIEYHGGNFPLWLSPIQIMIIPISVNFEHYALRVKEKLINKGFRVDIDLRSEKVNYRIREAEIKKIPYMFVIGQKEEDTNSVAVRKHTEGDLGIYHYEDAVDLLNEEI